MSIMSHRVWVVPGVVVAGLLAATALGRLGTGGAEASVELPARYEYKIDGTTVYIFDRDRGNLRIWQQSPHPVVTTYRHTDPEVILQDDFKFRTGV